MAIGERMPFIRTPRGITQKWIDQAAVSREKVADVGMVQYESGFRTPKEDLGYSLFRVRDVFPFSLKSHNIDSLFGFIHTFFAIENMRNIRVKRHNDGVPIVFDGRKPTTMDKSIITMFSTCVK